MIDDPIRRLAQPSALPLMTRLGTARFRPLLLLLAIRRGRFGGGARGLLWPLHPQHQIDQLGLAQTLKLVPAHPDRESAKPIRRKGVGNYNGGMLCLHFDLTSFRRTVPAVRS